MSSVEAVRSKLKLRNCSMVGNDPPEVPLPLDVGDFTLYACIGQAFNRTASVYLAKRNGTQKPCAIRVYQLENGNSSFCLLRKEVATLRSLKHPNILSLEDVIVKGTRLLIVNPLMDYGSVRDLLLYRFNLGMVEQHIAVILYDVLKVIHAGWNNFSRTIRGSHILLSSSGYACLSGFRLAASFVNESQRLRSLHDFDSNFKTSLLWLAPEVLQQFPAGYDLKSDIYSVGITACEMANGFPPFADMTSLQMFMEKLRGVTPRLLDGKTLASDEGAENIETSLNEQRNRWFSDKFHSVVDICLRFVPSESRPTASELLKHSFFKQCKKERRSAASFLHDVKPLFIKDGALATMGLYQQG
ncbi:STE20 kinase adapter protein alpha [Trichuris trichiura]|uniref:STE20 kinase adapter protein alpha n=1 Tax=Trichuris trichiura TaxID=36087 RepID=A0A077ZL39_TRITR|nr:STE20 kinase adapter protein alpha [Trichuris trichiura]